LRTELAAGENLRLVPGEDVARMKMDLPLADVDSLARDTLQRVQRHLGADYVVLGSYLDVAVDDVRRVRFDVRVQDATSGETVVSISEAGRQEQILEIVSTLGARLRQRLAVSDAVGGGDGNT